MNVTLNGYLCDDTLMFGINKVYRKQCTDIDCDFQSRREFGLPFQIILKFDKT